MSGKETLHYPSARGGPELGIDLYRPDGPPRSLVVHAHGGGFSHGKRDNGFARDCAARLVAEGVAFASIDYSKGDPPPERFTPAEWQVIEHAQARTNRIGLKVNPQYCGARMYAALEDYSAAFLRLGGPDGDLDLSDIPMLAFGASAGGIIAASLAYPPRDWPPLFRPDAAFGVCAAMVQPWRLTSTGPPLRMMHSFHDGVISPRNMRALRNKAAAKDAPVDVVTSNVKGHRQQLDALLTGADDEGVPYWSLMQRSIEDAIAYRRTRNEEPST